MEIVTWLREYGVYGLLLWMIAERVLPFIRDAILPARAEERKHERARLAALEERQVQAIEKISEAVAGMATLYATISEQLRCVQDDQRENYSKLLEIAKMLEQRKNGLR